MVTKQLYSIPTSPYGKIDWNGLAAIYQQQQKNIFQRRAIKAQIDYFVNSTLSKSSNKKKGISTTAKIILALALFTAGVYSHKKGNINNMYIKIKNFIKEGPIQDELPRFAEAMKAANK